MNLYRYVANDPINAVDFTGLEQYNCDGTVTGAEGSDVIVVCPEPPPPPPPPTGQAALANAAPGDDGKKKDKPQSGQPEESAPCRILRQSAEAAQGVLPSRVGLNGGFRDPANLTFYRLTYEQNLRDAGYAEYALYGAAVLSGVGGYFGVIGAGTSLAAGTGAGTSGLLADALGDTYRQYIQAIRDIEKYNNSGC